MPSGLVQTSVSFAVAMKHIAVKLKQHFQCTVLVIAQAAKQRRVPLMISRFYEVLMNAKLAKHGCKLPLSVRYGMMQCVSSALVLND